MRAPKILPAAAHWIARHTWLTFAAVFAVIVPLIVLGGRVRPDNRLEVWFVERDPALVAYREFLRDFGSDDAIVIAFDTDSAGADANVQHALADSLKAIKGVGRTLTAADLGPVAPMVGLAAMDGSAAAVVAWLDTGSEIEAERPRIVAQVDSAASRALGAGMYHLAGTSILYEGLNKETLRDTGIFLSLALVIMVAVLAATLRGALAVAIALVPSLLCAGAAMGIVALSGRPLTLVGSALPTLVMVIGLTDGIHVVMHCRAMRDARPPRNEDERRLQVADAVAWVALPCLFTSLSTAAGFAALGFSRIAAVRDFGWLAAVGVLLAWAGSLPLMAAALARWDVGPTRPSPLASWLDRVPQYVAANLARRRWVMLSVAVLTTIVFAAGIPRVRVDTHTIGLLPEKHQVRRDSDWIERRLGAYTPLEFVVEAPEGVRDSAFQAKFGTWRTQLLTIPGVARTVSAASAAYVRADGRAVRLTAHVPMTTAREFERIARAGEREGLAVFGDASRVRAAGYLPLYVRIVDYVVQSTVSGLGSAFILVFALVALLVRSWRAFAVALPPNLLPIVVVFGVMGWAGIPLDIATATVGSIVLGIVVDDTIHYLVHFQEVRREEKTSAAAAARALRDAGPAMMLTGLVLTAGFGVMMAAGTKSIAYFGLVTTIAIVAALGADLMIVPALLAKDERKRA